MHGQPRVTFRFDAARNAGLTVIAPGDPEFQASLLPFRQNPAGRMDAFAVVEPFSFVITNTSKRAIAMLAVRWERTDGGVTRPLALFTYRHRTKLIDASFQPGQALLLSPGAGGFGPTYAAVSPAAGRLAQQFSEADALTCTIDAIAFGDGEVVGEDHYGLAVRLEAERQAIGDLVEDLSGIIGRHEESQEFLQKVSAEEAKPTLPSAQDHQRDFAYHYTEMRATAARLMAAESPDARVQLEKLKLIYSRMSVAHPQHVE